MAQDVVINGTTYPAVESVALTDGNGNVTMYYPDAVRYVPQTLTDEQKAQARGNIGAISENKPPSYYDTYLSEKIASVQALLDNAGSDASAFIFFSDTHQKQPYAPVLAKAVADECGIQHVIFAGDINGYSLADEATTLAQMTDAEHTRYAPIAEKLLRIKGNHDGAYGTGANSDDFHTTKAKVYSRLWRFNHADGYGEGGGYFYRDDEAEKTRYIVIDTFDFPEGEAQEVVIRQAQYDWLKDALNVEDGWSVICFLHVPPVPAYSDIWSEYMTLREFLGAYKDKTTYSHKWDGTHGGGYTNLADQTSADWANDKRINSSGQEVTATGVDITNLIPVSGASEIHVKGLDILSALSSGANYGRVYWYDADKNYVGYRQPSSKAEFSEFFQPASYDDTTTVIDWKQCVDYWMENKNTSYIRLGGIPTSDKIIITVDEPIISNGGYTNLFNTSCSGFLKESDTKFLTNWMPYNPNDNDGKGTIYHFKGLQDNSGYTNPYKFHFAEDENGKYYDGTSGTALAYCTNANQKANVTADYDSSVKLFQHSYTESGANIAYIQFEIREALPANLIITANEDIIEASGDAGWDALDINADFTGYKGNFVAVFAGHIHGDYSYYASSYGGIDVHTICCDANQLDGRSYNDETQYPEFGGRQNGTVYEQALDVVVVNRKTHKINTVRIGAGYDREFSY